MEERQFLPIGSRIETEQGSVFRINGEPVGLGGGSILYPVQRLYWQHGVLQTLDIPYVLKECYPISSSHCFTRNSSGEVVPKSDNPESLQYLRRSQYLLREEGMKSQRIYQTASRILPIQELSQSITLTIPEQEPVVVSNTVTIMDSLSEKGQSLSLWMKEQGRFSPLAAFRIIQQLLFSLKEVHQAGYLHLDIQDGNVFLHGALRDRSELVTLIDFGSARPIKEGKTEAIIDRVIFTTQGYSAPEILTGNDGTLRLGAEADIYSVGCLLLYLLTGQKPMSANLLRNRTGIYLQPNQIRRIKCPKHLIDRLQKILRIALAIEPENRYHSADAMLEEITAFIDELMPARSSLANVDYDAFICYKHGEVDSEAAKLLQRKLEDFRAPRGIAPHPFKRVFLDDGELSSCADFGEQIRSALKNASWLIVICSPTTPLSPWVKSEIETFLEYHDRSRILAVLTGGKPDESFPKQLLGINGEGEVLAADSRGETLREVRKKLCEDVLLRIAAPMLGTTFDSLKQRRKNQRMQRIAAIIAAGLAAALAFSAYALRQNRRIREAYRRNLIHESKYLAVLAEDAYDHADSLNALELALRALPSEAQDRPVIPQAQLIAEQALGLYAVNDGNMLGSAKVRGLYQHADDVTSQGYCWDYDRDILLSCDEQDIYIWDASEGTILDRISLPTDNHVFFRDYLVNQALGLLYYSCNDTIYCYDYVKSEMLWNGPLTTEYTVAGMGLLPGGQLAVIFADGGYGDSEVSIRLLEGSCGTLAREYQVPLERPFSSLLATQEIVPSQDGTVLAFRYPFSLPDDYSTGDGVVILNLETSDTSFYYSEDASIEDLLFTPEGMLLIYSLSEKASFWNRDLFIFDESVATLSLLDSKTGNLLWTLQESYNGGAVSCYPGITLLSGANAIAVAFYANKCLAFQYPTGEIKGRFDLTAAVVNVCPIENGDFFAFTADGLEHLCYLDSTEWIAYQMFPEGLHRITRGKDGDFMVVMDDNQTVIRRFELFSQDNNWELYDEDLSNPLRQYPQSYFKDGWFVLYGDYDEPITIVDTTNGRTQEVVPSCGEDTCAVSSEEIQGIFEINGRPTLVFTCWDVCEKDDHGLYSGILCIQLDSLEQRIIYIPQPVLIPNQGGLILDGNDTSGVSDACSTNVRRSLSAIAFTDTTVFFTCNDVFCDGNRTYWKGFSLYSWEMASDTLPKQIAVYSDPQQEHDIEEPMDMTRVEAPFGEVRIVPSSDQKRILIAAKGSIPSLIDVYCAEVKDGSCKKILSDINIGQYASLVIYHDFAVRWNGRGDLFALLSDDAITVYTLQGAVQSQYYIKDAFLNVSSMFVVPNTDHLLVWQDGPLLSKYDMRSGELLAQDEIAYYVDYSFGNLTWVYLNEHMLIMQFPSWVAVIDPSEDTWGMCSFIPSAIGYHAQQDRFYTISSSSGGKQTLGSFRRYSIEEIVAMGNALLGE